MKKSLLHICVALLVCSAGGCSDEGDDPNAASHQDVGGAAVDSLHADGNQLDSAQGAAVDVIDGDATATGDAGAADSAVDVGGVPDATATADVAPGPAQPADGVSAAVPTAWGKISGLCDKTLLAPGTNKPQFIVNTYHFDNVASFNAKPLAAGPKKRFEQANAGGSSKCSEVMSMQLFVDCAAASVHKTETEITYDKTGPITDYMLAAGSDKLGVSVTRAYKGPVIKDYSVKDATALLQKKLAGINTSTANVSAADKWKRQVLHVWTMQPAWVQHLQDAWASLDKTLRSDTIVVVTVEQGTEIIVPDKCD